MPPRKPRAPKRRHKELDNSEKSIEIAETEKESKPPEKKLKIENNLKQANPDLSQEKEVNNEEGMAVASIYKEYWRLPWMRLQISSDFSKIYELAAELYTNFLEELREKEFSSPVIDIPPQMLSPNSLQSGRFTANDPQDPLPIKVTLTDSIHKYLKEIFVTMRTSYKILVGGPKGIGKSYLLALFVLILRMNPEARVLYINNLSRWKSDPYNYIRNEIIYCFFRDAATLPPPPEDHGGISPLEKWSNYMSKPLNKFEAIIVCLNTLKEHVNKTNGRLIFVIDEQDNIFQRLKQYGDSSEKLFVKEFELIFSEAHCDRKVISASPNNEHYVVTKYDSEKDISKLFKPYDCVNFLNQNWMSKVLKLSTPTEAELYKLLDPRNFNEQKAHQSQYWNLIQIIQVTKQNPLELKCIIDLANSDTYCNFESLFDAYFEERVNYYLEIHAEYCRTTNDISESFKIATFLDSGKSFDSFSSRIYNQELIEKVVDPENESMYQLESVCLAASKATEKYHICKKMFGFSKWFCDNKNDINEAINCTGSAINSKNFTSGMYNENEALKKLILWKISMKNQFDLHYWSSHSNAEKSRKLSLNINEVRYFNAKRLYSLIQEFINFYPGKSAVFIPNSAACSLVDYILVQSTKEPKSGSILYLFKITINIKDSYKGDQVIFSQINENDTIDYQDNICKVVKDLKRNNLIQGYRFVWLTNETNISDLKKEIQSESWLAKIDNIDNI